MTSKENISTKCNGKIFKQGIKHTLVDKLRGIIYQYNDKNIIKELVQNADDANATEVKLLFDVTTYPSESLLRKGLEEFQGPALLVYNNETLKENDWEGILRLENSVKSSDPLQVGQFGIGFKSVFHITEFVTLVSGNTIAFIDPHEKYFLNDDEYKTSGFDLDIEEDSHEIAICPDQWQPLKHSIFGTDACSFESGKPLQGTIFRFPLRNKTDSRQISSAVYEEIDVDRLFKSVQDEGYLYLLFCKNIESIKVYKKNDTGNTSLQFEICISEHCQSSVRKKRKYFYQQVKDKKESSVTYKVELLMKYYIDNELTRTESKEYLISQLFSNCGNDEIQALTKRLPKALPIVGVAYQLHQKDRIPSQLFVSLPLTVVLPSPTGLPVHVNGYFCVDRNRKHLKQRESGHSGSDSDEVRWNELLIFHLLPKVLVDAVLEAKRNLLEISQIYKMFPDPDDVIQLNWSEMTQTFYQLISKQPVILTRQGKTWKCVTEVSVLPKEWDSTFKVIIVRIFSETGKSLADLPDHIRKGFERYEPSSLQEVTTEMIVESINSVKPKSKLSVYLSSSQKLRLLDYILQTGNTNYLIGLPLLPLESGKWIEFSTSGKSPIFLEDGPHKKSLFCRNVKSVFLKFDEMTSELRKRIHKLAESGETQLNLLNKNSFLKYFQNQMKEQTQYPGEEYLKNLWEYLYLQFSDSLEVFSHLYILPLKRESLERLPKKNDTVIFSDVDTPITDTEEELIKSLGITIYPAICEYALKHPQINRLIFKSTVKEKSVSL